MPEGAAPKAGAPHPKVGIRYWGTPPRSKASPKQANPMPEGDAPKAGASMPMAVAKAEAGPWPVTACRYGTAAHWRWRRRTSSANAHPYPRDLGRQGQV